MRWKQVRKFFFGLGLLGLLCFVLTACSSNKQVSNGKISIVTTTNVYANIAQNVVGKYGKATAIIQKSSTDPHDFEPTTADAKKLVNAKIVVANGLGYDSWMNKLADSANKKSELLLVGEDLMGLKKGDNPHIWYNLSMPTKYVHYLVKRLSKMDKKHANYFAANGKAYLAKVAHIQRLAHRIDSKGSKPVFVSEPVFDYALQEAGYHVGDRDFEDAVENETDPSPKVVNHMTKAIKARKIAFFVNNTQASSSVVNNFVKWAKSKHLPVLNVRETIPAHTTYLNWMQENYQKLATIKK